MFQLPTRCIPSTCCDLVGWMDRVSAKEVRRELKAKIATALNLVKDANERASGASAKKLLLSLRRQILEPHFEPFDHGYKDLKVGFHCRACLRLLLQLTLMESLARVLFPLDTLQSFEADMATFVASYLSQSKGPGTLSELPDFIKVCINALAPAPL
jgi:hypothetical protein